MKRAVARGLVLLVVLYVAAAALRIHQHKYDIWLSGYVRWLRTNQSAPDAVTKHVLVFVADHFEPNYYSERLFRWQQGYPALARAHRDYYGRVHQHTWFYPGEQLSDANLAVLRQMAAGGFGEVELHFHHSFDTYASLEQRLEDAIGVFQQYGFLKTVDGKTRFGFIHGNFALDNSQGPELCGVDEEIRLLLSLGCYADFGFPSIWETSQPRTVNAIYETVDDPRPKSYDTVLPLQGAPLPNHLVIFEGPLLIGHSWNPARLFLHVEDGDLHDAIPPSPARADRWVRTGIHVPQRPEWIFVKLWTHGASSDEQIDANLAAPMSLTLSYMESKYNDGRRYILHYVTAREAYNVARAAAAGMTGDPRQYYDYEIKPYVADNVGAGYRVSHPLPPIQ